MGQVSDFCVNDPQGRPYPDLPVYIDNEEIVLFHSDFINGNAEDLVQ